MSENKLGGIEDITIQDNTRNIQTLFKKQKSCGIMYVL